MSIRYSNVGVCLLFSNIPAVAQAYVAPAMSRSGMMTNEVGNIDTCVRCKAQVFIAEKRQAAGNVSCIQLHICVLLKSSGLWLLVTEI